jgi:hypothetical protein
MAQDIATRECHSIQSGFISKRILQSEKQHGMQLIPELE